MKFTPEPSLACCHRIDDPGMVVTIFDPPSPDGVSLKLLPDEWDELWQLYLSSTKRALNNGVKGFLYNICDGQVGAAWQRAWWF
jgi:hypothetical protein